MSVRPISVIPQDREVLRARAKKIRTVDHSVLSLVEDMIDSMHAAAGVGLAAPQIGVSLRLVVIGMPGQPPFALVNPEIVKIAGERLVFEGCLSVPGYRGEVQRAERVVAKARDLNGRELRIRADDDLLAQALQHEIDHVNGTLYIDHVREPEDLHRLPEAEPVLESSEDESARD